jgi:Kef-type K+ transport system membrane component KefB
MQKLKQFFGKFHIAVILGTLFFTQLSQPILAATSATETEGGHVLHHSPKIFIVLALLLVAAKIFHLIEKIKLPPVVGELIAGIVLGNLAMFGWHYFDEVGSNDVVKFLAEFGVIILLFQIGLESNAKELTKVGGKSISVALIGAFLPFLLGSYLVGPWLLPGQDTSTYLFLGAALAATSVSIPSKVLMDMGKMQTKAAKIFLGATVIDDVLGLVILAVISGLVSTGEMSLVSIALTFFKSFAFLLGSVVLGQLIAPKLGKAFSKINTGMGTKFTFAISFGLLFAGLAASIGLEPIIGAFAAGLVLDHVHFKLFRDPSIVGQIKDSLADHKGSLREKIDKILHFHSRRNVEDIIEPLSLFFAPIFFVVTGMSVKLESLMSWQTLFLALILTVAAVVGKVAGGLALKEKYRFVVGLAMVPRGEVGLIFASVGQSLGVLSDQVFSVIVMTVLLTTIIGPFLLAQAIKKQKSLDD